MAGDARSDHMNGVPAIEARLDADEARLSYDEARLEAEEAEVQENRIVAWFGVAIALVLVVAVTALVLSVFALRDDVGTMRRFSPAGSVGTLSLRDEAVTREKLAPGAVDRTALAGAAVGREQIAPGAVGREQIAAGSIAGAQVARDALTGAAIKERTLGVVPAARTARTASDSARLGGLPSRVFLSSVVDVRIASGTDVRQVKGPLVARCPTGSRVLSGGARIRGAARGAAIVTNAPEQETGWTATARVSATPARTWQLVVSAVCADGGE
jgi:hypothetical protein